VVVVLRFVEQGLVVVLRFVEEELVVVPQWQWCNERCQHYVLHSLCKAQ